MSGKFFDRRYFMKSAGASFVSLGMAGAAFSDNKVSGGRAEIRDYSGCEVLKVGLCQIQTEEWAVEDNTKRTIAAFEAAAARGAEIAITPECVLHGYGLEKMGSSHERLRETSEPIDGKNARLLCAKAKELNICFLVGLAERGEGNRIYNSAVMISNKGDIISVYHKVHCRAVEDTRHGGPFTAGEDYIVSDLKFDERRFKAGTMICFDREVPEGVRCLRSLGAEIIFCPMAWYTYDMARCENFAHNEMITRCRAAENEVFIVVVNHAGRFNGGSFVVGPAGELIHQMGEEAGVEVVEVPVGVVQKKFHSNPLGWMGWGYRRQLVYDKYLKQKL